MLENNLESKYKKIDGKEKDLQQIICENIKVSEKLRCDIYKETDIFRMLDLSLLCISTMTGDRTFMNRIEKRLLAICVIGIINKRNRTNN